jgi:hypothetical protein
LKQAEKEVNHSSHCVYLVCVCVCVWCVWCVCYMKTLTPRSALTTSVQATRYLMPL